MLRGDSGLTDGGQSVSRAASRRAKNTRPGLIHQYVHTHQSSVRLSAYVAAQASPPSIPANTVYLNVFPLRGESGARF